MSSPITPLRGAPGAPPAPVQGALHTVRYGETLAGIAKAHGTSVAELLQANPQLDNPNRIYPGQVLQVPAAAHPAPAQRLSHTVRSGDTLAELAARYHTDVSTLMRINRLRNPNLIHVGEQIRLPAGAQPVPTPKPAPAAPVPAPAAPVAPASGAQRGITEADYEAAARKLGVDVPAIKAVAEVEARGDGFLASGKPKILFEAHHFSRHTGHQYDASHPDISSPRWNKALYGKAGEHQWERYERAAALDEKAAMLSTSWGRFQIMGFNHEAAGYKDVASFVDAMKRSEGAQLDAFASFVQSNPGMHRALQNHDWAAFARAYNGPGYAENQYDTKMAQAYARHSR